ncbi:hypothetical protein GCM10023116_04550 [Kistimonas scapharcae]|uniref:HMG box domain-containing protein n=1 Tax=Kistimonas scapharcae TaxID=1036133 RepID=A0ABP8UWS5_9GAMM
MESVSLNNCIVFVNNVIKSDSSEDSCFSGRSVNVAERVEEELILPMPYYWNESYSKDGEIDKRYFRVFVRGCFQKIESLDKSCSQDEINDIACGLVLESDSVEKRKKRKHDVSRPPNSFLVFRSWFNRKYKLAITSQQKVSIECSNMWRMLSKSKQEMFKVAAHKAESLHKEMYPEYKFTPIKKVFKESDPLETKAPINCFHKE